MGEFNKDLSFGKDGEYIIYKFLCKHESTLDLINVSDDKWFQNFDIDYLQKTKNGINKIEIKTDRIAHRTGNIVYEFISNKYCNSLGCFKKTEADFLFYYLYETKILYIFVIEELKEWVSQNKNKLKVVDMGDCAIGYLIKLKDLSDIYTKIYLKES